MLKSLQFLLPLFVFVLKLCLILEGSGGSKQSLLTIGKEPPAYIEIENHEIGSVFMNNMARSLHRLRVRPTTKNDVAQYGDSSVKPWFTASIFDIGQPCHVQ